MKSTTTAFLVGTLVLLIGIMGLSVGEGRRFEELNVDLALDGVRIALGAFLIYAALRSSELARKALYIFGALYLGMFVLGLIDPTLFGILPSGLGSIDQALHLMGGIIGIILPLLFTPKRRERLAV